MRACRRSRTSVREALRARLRSTVLVPGDRDYDRARRVWNGSINRRPSCIIRRAAAEDASHAVRVASDHGLPLTIRGGGYNVAGRSIGEGKMLLDLSGLRQVAVNRDSKIATVQGGAMSTRRPQSRRSRPRAGSYRVLSARADKGSCRA